MVHKGFGDRLDIGISAIAYQGQSIYGGDVKVVLYQPEEGPTFALRMSYAAGAFSYTTSAAELAVNTQTYKPELIVSKKLDFADPYIGVGYQIIRGSIDIGIPVPIQGPGIPAEITGSANGQGSGAVGIIGVGLRVPGLGLKLTMDEEYSTIGAHALGVAIGFMF